MFIESQIDLFGIPLTKVKKWVKQIVNLFRLGIHRVFASYNIYYQYAQFKYENSNY